MTKRQWLLAYALISGAALLIGILSANWLAVWQ